MRLLEMRLFSIPTRFAARAFMALAFCHAFAQTPVRSENSPAPTYILHAGDTLDIKIYNLPELNQGVVIRPDGVITTAMGDEIRAAGLTASELSSRLAVLYGKTFRFPRVSVSVVGFSNQKVYVGGEVAAPGVFPLDGELSVVSALIRAGGAKESGELTDVMLIRGTEHRHLDVASILAMQTHDVELQPGDMIYVPKSTVSVYVGGEVAQPGLETLQGNTSALTAIIKAGGAQHTASLHNVVLIRNSGVAGKPEIRLIDVQAALKGLGPDVPLHPFDVVYVPRTRISRLDQFIDQYMRQLSPLPLNGGFSYLLNTGVVVP
jgi:polysaccharide export outer membrane protein